MRSRAVRIGVVLAVALATTALVASARGGQTASTTMVFGTEADPALMDPSLVSDGPSLRATDQIFESLVGFKLGSTAIVPELALELEAEQERARRGSSRSARASGSKTARSSTPQRSASTSTAGTTSRRRCRATRVSYYWNTVFGGFAHPAPGNPGRTRACTRAARRTGNYSVDLLLTRRSSSFLGAIASAELRHREPDGAEEVPGRCRHGRRDGRVPSDRDVRDAASRSAPGRTCSKSWQIGNKLVLVGEPEVLGHEAEARQRSSSGRSRTTPRGCRRCRPARSRATTSSTRPTSARSRATRA